MQTKVKLCGARIVQTELGGDRIRLVEIDEQGNTSLDKDEA